MNNHYEQTEAFPRSTMEILDQLRGVHASALEKAIDALDALSDDEKIAKRYEKAVENVAGCRELLSGIDRALAELKQATQGTGTVADALADMKRHAEAVGGGVSITVGGETFVIAEPPAECDPITGEVVSKPHTGDEVSQTPHVFVFWPGESDPDMDRPVQTEMLVSGNLAAYRGVDPYWRVGR